MSDEGFRSDLDLCVYSRDTSFSDDNKYSDRFNASIPSKYILKNKMGILIFSSIFDFYSIDVMADKITNSLISNTSYNCLVKVRHQVNDFFMAGSQFGFKFNSFIDIINLVYTVKARISEYLEQYRLPSDYIDYVQLNFRQLDEKFISEFTLSKPKHLDDKKLSEVKQMLTIPVSVVPLGNSLNIRTDNGIVKYIPVIIEGKETSFLDVINESAKLARMADFIFDDSYKFYYVNSRVYVTKYLGSNVL